MNTKESSCSNKAEKLEVFVPLYLSSLFGGAALLPFAFGALLLCLRGLANPSSFNEGLAELLPVLGLMVYTTVAVYIWKLRHLKMTVAKVCLSFYVFGGTYISFHLGSHFLSGTFGYLIGGVAPIAAGVYAANRHRTREQTLSETVIEQMNSGE